MQSNETTRTTFAEVDPAALELVYEVGGDFICRNCGADLVSNFERRGQFGHTETEDIVCRPAAVVPAALELVRL
jgi:hypothetical protein